MVPVPHKYKKVTHSFQHDDGENTKVAGTDISTVDSAHRYDAESGRSKRTWLVEDSVQKNSEQLRSIVQIKLVG